MENSFLSSAELKAKAKEALTGKYGKFILAILVVDLITLAAKYIVTLFFSMFAIMVEIPFNEYTVEEIQQLTGYLAYMQDHSVWYNAINYVLQIAVDIFTSVFNVGIWLFCLNLACGRTLKITDVFYGFRNQMGKSLCLSAVLTLVSQICYLPSNILSYLIRNNAPGVLILSILLLYVGCTIIYVPISLSISQMFLLMLDFPGYSTKELIKLSAHIMKGHKGRLFYIQLSFLPLIFLSLLTFGIGNLWLIPYMNITYTFFFLNLMQARDATLSVPTY